MPSLVDIDPSERLSQDDLATQTEAQFLEAAMRVHREQAAAQRSLPGCCASCGERCHPSAVYCDAACREDHERRLAARVRNGSGGAL